MDVPRSKNPYNAETPIEDPTMFFGREQELSKIIEARIKHAHPISTILIGGRKIGKTSLLYQIRNQLLGQTTCGPDIAIPVFVTFHGRASLDTAAVYTEIISGIARSLREYRGLHISPGDLAGDSYKAFCKQLRAIWHQCGEKIGSVRFVILIDEADRLLGHPWTKDVISNFRDLINTSDQKSYVALVVTGFRELHDYALMEEEGIGSAFGNAPRWTSLRVLTETECSNLITLPVNGEVSQDVVALIYEQSGGHPYITQYLMQEIWKPNPAEITPTDVKRACNRFKKEVKIFPSWRKRFTALDEQVYRALAQTQKPLTFGEIHKRTAVEAEPGEIGDSLDFLGYTGVVVEQDKEYVAVGRLYRDWFLERSQKENKIVRKPQKQQGFDIPRMLVGTLVVIVLFVVTIVMLVWAAGQVHPLILAFIVIIAVVFDLVSAVTVLVMNGILRQKWAMYFYNTVFGRMASMLNLSLDHLMRSHSQEDKSEKATDNEDKWG